MRRTLYALFVGFFLATVTATHAGVVVQGFTVEPPQVKPPVAPAIPTDPLHVVQPSAFQAADPGADPYSDSVGATTGQYAVDPSGAPSYSLPLYVPTGSANMQPSLALSYSSRGSNGPIGAGWSVSGLSVISRCKKGTEFGDGAAPFPQPNFDSDASNDAYCLDGARLLPVTSPGLCPVNGVNTGNVQAFGLELDTTTLVCGYKPNTPTTVVGFGYWLVEPADGSLRRYGFAGSSALPRNTHGTAVSPVDGYLSWALDRQADRSGNAIDFSYLLDAANGEMEISQVAYTAKVDVSALPAMPATTGTLARSSFANLTFNYEAMPAAGQRIDYLSGMKLALTKRLASITVNGQTNHTNVSVTPSLPPTTPAVVRTYHLGYTASVTSGLSTLTSLKECAPNGSGEVCYPATSFAWNSTKAPGIGNETYGTVTNSPFAYARDFKVGNIQGNGTQSFVYVEDRSCGPTYTGARFRFRTTIVGIAGLQEVGTPIDYPLDTTRPGIPASACGDLGPMHIENTYALYDFNGDGRDDLIVLTTTGWVVYLSNASAPGFGFSTTSTTLNIPGGASEDGKLVDVFGDGLPALLHGVAGGTFHARHLMRTTSATAPYQFSTTDVPLVFDSPTDLDSGVTVSSIGINTDNARVLAAGDIDGNGAADLIMRVLMSNSKKRWYVYRNAGMSGSNLHFVPDEDLEPNGAPVLSDDGNDVQFVDFAGNGQAGVLYQVPVLGGASQEIHYRLNIGKPNESAAGSRFAADGGAVITLPVARAKRVQVMDINQDHKADLVYYDKIGTNNWPLEANLFGTAGFGPTIPLCSGICYDTTVDSDITLSMFLDSNGDGEPMLYRFQFGTGGFGTGANNLAGLAPDTLASITNGFGANTQITYSPLTVAAAYTRGTGSAQLNLGRLSPVFDVFGPFWVVTLSQSTAPTDDASIGPSAATTTTAQVAYRYAGARMQAGGRGFLGFASVTTTDLQASSSQYVQTTTSYRQDFPYIGRPGETLVNLVPAAATDPCILNPNGQHCHPCNPCNLAPAAPETAPIKVTDSFDYYATRPAFAAGTTQPLAVYRFDSDEEHYDAASGAFSHRTDTAVTIDAYGNSLTTTVTSSHADPTSGNEVVDETLTTANIFGCTTSPPTVAGCPTAGLNAERQRLGRLSLSTITSSGRAGGNTTRRASFEYDATTYQLYSEIQGPYADLLVAGEDGVPLGLRTDYVLDASGNRTETVQCSTADFATRTACLSLSGFVQQPSSPTQIQRYSKTTWEGLGRFPLYTKIPFFSSSSAAGNEMVSQLVGVESQGGGVFGVGRDPFGNPINSFDGNSVGTNYFYGLMGRKYLTSSFTGAFTSTNYMWCQDAGAPDIPAGAPRANCPFGAIYRMMDSEVDGGTAIRPTVYTYYDALGRTVLKTSPVYQASGTASHWSSVASVYDTEGRVVKTSVPYFSVDPTALQVAATTRAGYPETTSPLPAAETASYDAVSRPLDEVHPEASSKTVMSYDRSATTMVNPRLFSSASVKNGRAETIRITDQAGLNVDYTKGGFGTTTAVTRTPTDGDASGITINTTMSYDRLGRKTGIGDPDKGNWTYGYNALGEQVSQTDAKGQKQYLYHDALGRLFQRTELFANGTTEQTSTWTYDIAVRDNGAIALGLLAAESNGLAGFTKTPGYDRFGRVSGMATAFSETAMTTYTETQTYDDYSRPLTHTDPTTSLTASSPGETITYSSDGFAIQINDAAGTGGILQQLLGMSPRGQTAAEEYGNSNAMKIVRDFDPVTGRLTRVHSGSSIGDGNALQNWYYSYDKHNNLLTRLNQATGYNQQESFVYDGLDRLITHNLDTFNGAAVNIALTNIAYDGLGNITNKSGTGLGSYSYSTQQSGCSNAAGVHAVTLAGASQRFCYDANGNQTAAIGTRTRTIGYTSYDLPAKIVQTAPSLIEIDFKYAPDRSLWKRTDGVSITVPGTGRGCAASSDRIFCNGFEDGSTPTIPGGTGGVPTYYVGNIEVIGSGSSATTKRYVGSFLVVTTTSSNPGGTYNYLFKDSIGSIDLITTASGVVVQRESFDAHGARRNALPVAPAMALLTAAQLASFDTSVTRESFTGHWGLEAVGLIHMKGRLYDPLLGRFIQADPFTERDASQGLNRYSYVLNNPLSLTDPTGYMSFDQVFGIAIGIVAGIASGGLYSAGMLWASFGVAVGGGFVSAWVGSGFNATAGLWGAFAGGLFWGIGTVFQQSAAAHDTGMACTSGLTQGAQWAKVAVHGVAGGVLNSLRGANFGNGFWAAGATEALSPEIDKLGGNAAGRVSLAALIGGTVSAATGGKFANGAETAFFQAVFNAEAHRPEQPEGTIVGISGDNDLTGYGTLRDAYLAQDLDNEKAYQSLGSSEELFGYVATRQVNGQTRYFFSDMIIVPSTFDGKIVASLPLDAQIAGFNHSHPLDPDRNQETFSPRDSNLVTNTHLPFAVRTPLGDVRELNPNNNNGVRIKAGTSLCGSAPCLPPYAGGH